jgi:hypothetical protein
MTEILALVAAGTVVHPTMQAMQRLFGRTDIAWVPIRDLPPGECGLIWLTANLNGRIRAFVDVALSSPQG